MVRAWAFCLDTIMSSTVCRSFPKSKWPLVQMYLIYCVAFTYIHNYDADFFKFKVNMLRVNKKGF